MELCLGDRLHKELRIEVVELDVGQDGAGHLLVQAWISGHFYILNIVQAWISGHLYIDMPGYKATYIFYMFVHA